MRIRPIMPAAIFIVLLISCVTRGQNQNQGASELWFEVDPAWNLNKRWVLDVNIVQHFAQVDPRWWETGATPNLEFSLRKWISFESGLVLIYTNQGDTINTFETRPYVGVKLKLEVWRGIRLSLRSRYETRFQTDLDTGQTAFTPRSRNRLQALIPINNRSLFDNGTYYVLLEAEGFISRSSDLKELFKNKERFRAGIGWRKDGRWNIQVLYVRENLRKSPTTTFLTSDNAFCLRIIPTLKQ